MSNSSTVKIWCGLEGTEAENCHDFNIEAKCTVSSLVAIVVNSNKLDISSVANIASIKLNDKELKMRQLVPVDEIKEDSTFWITLKDAPSSSSDASSDSVDGEKEDGKGKEKEPKEEKEKEKKEKGDWDNDFLEHFKVSRNDVRDKETGEIVDKEVILTLVDTDLRDSLREEINSEELYETSPKVNAYELVCYLEKLQAQTKKSPDHPYAPLVKFLNFEFADLKEKVEKMLKEGRISYGYLWYLFTKGKKFYSFESLTGEKVGSEVTTFGYKCSFFGKYFSVSGKIIQTQGSSYVTATKEFRIWQFSGLKKISDLPVRPMDDDTMKFLVKRGRLFAKYSSGEHYLKYVGAMYKKSWYSELIFKADGRVMVDASSFRRMCPDYSHEDFFVGSRSNGDSNTEILEDELYITWPTVYGFSFSAKKWGELLVLTESNQGFTDIVFDDLAFSRLVIPAAKKQLISALVTHSSNAITDVISGKGSGCVFLLHGSPGVGKTLTAESIAELLHRPLYSVSVGELGTNTKELEDRLREILEVAAQWNAVTLLDEADIFLERRTDNDIHRNSMVGVFLRLLEYHQGVLFLTTNRVRNFDDAFHSRISVALKYNDLDANAREQIWKNFFEMAKITGIDPKPLAAVEINGRQIKNSVRLAQALAASEKSSHVTLQHIQRTIQVAQQFKEDLNQSVVEKEAEEEAEEKILEEKKKLKVQSKLTHSQEITVPKH